MTTNIVELFYSIQGEGLLTGQPFLFVRFSSCNLDCKYCDTKYSHQPTEQATIIQENSIKKIPNPVDIKTLAKILNTYNYHNITFTGGEPMLNARYIEKLLPYITSKMILSKMILIETNGTLYNNLSDELIRRVDYWAVDIKLPSVSNENTIEAHQQFLKRLVNAKHISIKTVFTPDTPTNELQLAYDIAIDTYRSHPDTALIFQPATFDHKIELGDNLNYIYRLAESSKMDVRMIPQVHRLVGVL